VFVTRPVSQSNQETSSSFSKKRIEHAKQIMQPFVLRRYDLVCLALRVLSSMQIKKVIALIHNEVKCCVMPNGAVVRMQLH